jgi:hypothetical protein
MLHALSEAGDAGNGSLRDETSPSLSLSLSLSHAHCCLHKNTSLPNCDCIGFNRVFGYALYATFAAAPVVSAKLGPIRGPYFESSGQLFLLFGLSLSLSLLFSFFFLGPCSSSSNSQF